MEGVALWVLGLTIGCCWLPFKLYEWVHPERIKRRERVQERIAVPIVVGLLLLMWVYLGGKILSKQEGYQFFVSVSIGVFAWFFVVLAQITQPLPEPEPQPLHEPEPKAPPKTYAIDGNNIARVNEGFSIKIVSTLARALAAEGHEVHIFFDANIGYLASEAGHASNGDGPLSLSEIANLLSFPKSSVTVVPGGTAADGWILRWAQHSNALIVTNDRYRDHLEDFQDFDEEVDRVTLTLIGDRIWLSDRKQPISMDM